MSKKRAAATFLVLVLMVILNILVFCCYKPSSGNEEINIAINLLSDSEKEMELFYVDGKEDTVDSFNAGQVESQIYTNKGEAQNLEYRIPASTRYIRLDLGMETSETFILGMQLQYGKQIQNVPIALLKNIVKINDIADISVSEQLKITSEDGDPYLVWNTEVWNVEEMTAREDFARNLILKIIICFCLDVIFIVGLRFNKKLVTLPIELWNNRRMIFNLSKNDFKTKYAGSYLGIFWAFVQPIVTVLLYWFVFEKGLKAGGVNTRAGIEVPFVLWLIAGLVPWFFFQDALNGATNALLEYSYLVKKVVFKISILPIIKMISALFVHLFFIVFMLLLYMANGYMPKLAWIQIIYYTICIFMLTLGIGFATCAIVIFFRDLSQIINIFLQVGNWMTPIMWNFQAMDLHPVLKMIFKLNPMYYVVEGYRQALIGNTWFWEESGLTIYFWLVVAAFFGIGSYVFKKLQVHFADVL